MNTQNKKDEKGWQFLNIGIAGPECMLPFIQKAVQTTFEKELEKADGIYSSSIDIPLEDEILDELLCVEVYGLHGSFSTFLSELRQYNVDSVTFGKEWTRLIFVILNEIAEYLKSHTNKPQAIKNKIISVLKYTEHIPILGLMSQITTLWGLVRMLECCGMAEDMPQYNDFISLHDWIVIEAGKRMYKFAQEPVNWIFSDEDMKRIQPFCDYLYYGTDIGKLANEMALGWVDVDSETDEIFVEESTDTHVPNIISNEIVAKAGRPKGKVVKSFQECFLVAEQDREETMRKLESMLDGKRGKDLALIILGCIKAGKISKPSFAQLKQAGFKVVGNESGYNRFMREKWRFKDSEIDEIAKKFK